MNNKNKITYFTKMNNYRYVNLVKHEKHKIKNNMDRSLIYSYDSSYDHFGKHGQELIYTTVYKNIFAFILCIILDILIGDYPYETWWKK